MIKTVTLRGAETPPIPPRLLVVATSGQLGPTPWPLLLAGAGVALAVTGAVLIATSQRTLQRRGRRGLGLPPRDPVTHEPARYFFADGVNDGRVNSDSDVDDLPKAQWRALCAKQITPAQLAARLRSRLPPGFRDSSTAESAHEYAASDRRAYAYLIHQWLRGYRRGLAWRLAHEAPAVCERYDEDEG